MRLLRLAMSVGWFAYWAIAARGAKATQWRAPLAAEWLHYTLALLGTIVLAAPARHARDSGPALFAAEPIRQRPRRHPHWTWSPGIAIARGSFLRRIGAPPSRSKKITRKPAAGRIAALYPIYSAILLTLLGSAIAFGRWRALLDFVLISHPGR